MSHLKSIYLFKDFLKLLFVRLIFSTPVLWKLSRSSNAPLVNIFLQTIAIFSMFPAEVFLEKDFPSSRVRCDRHIIVALIHTFVGRKTAIMFFQMDFLNVHTSLPTELNMRIFVLPLTNLFKRHYQLFLKSVKDAYEGSF